MDLSKLDSWRPYLLSYASGVLWIAAFAIWWLDPPTLRHWLVEFNDFAAAIPLIRVPDTVAVFAFLVVALVLPYSLALALRAPTYEIVSLFSLVQRRVFEHQVPLAAVVRKKADELVSKSLTEAGRLLASAKLAYLEQRCSESAQRLRGWGDEAAFGIVSMLPTAILTAGFLVRIAHVQVLWSSIMAALLFFLGTWWTNTAYYMWQLDLDSSVLLYEPFPPNPAKKKRLGTSEA